MGGEIEVVPFGKYRGRSVHDLMADESYCQWLAAQPWFRQRYGNVYNLVVNQVVQPQDTPEHNALQARFLDHAECLRLQYHLRGDLRSYWNRQWGSKMRERQRQNFSFEPETRQISSLSFESSGWDVHVTSTGELHPIELGAEQECHCVCDPERCNAYPGKTPEDSFWSVCYSPARVASPQQRDRHCTADCPAGWRRESSDAYLRATQTVFDQMTTAVELKPVIGDDYPTVLRQVLKRMDMVSSHRWDYDLAILIAEHAEFSKVSLEQVRKIFRTQRIGFLLLSDLPDAVPDSWRCLCSACAADPVSSSGQAEFPFA